MDTMVHTNGLTAVRPETLELGARYGWQTASGSEPVPVLFIAYDPCPAFVIVKDSFGKKMRCPRDQLISLGR
ncbi:MAG: hypothetical protein GX495_20280 [Chloroflexi bacterium]|jgi:hypothetical protein|nr:hypothetical protein [Chloroflexota bacterium]